MITHPLDEEESRRIVEALTERYRAELHEGEGFAVSGDLGDEAVTTTVVLGNRDGSETLEIEGRISLADNEMVMPHEALDAVLDLIDEFLQEYFDEERGLRIHPTWKAYDLGEARVEMRGRRRNLVLERAADEFLRNRAGRKG